MMREELPGNREEQKRRAKGNAQKDSNPVMHGDLRPGRRYSGALRESDFT